MSRLPTSKVLRSAAYHFLVVAGYFLLSLAVLWPMPLIFTTEIIGAGDTRSYVWSLWYAKEALIGQGSFFYADNLFYPTGISLLLNALGPLSGIVVAPLWFLGPAAVYNSALLLGFTFTGYCMYLLARNLGMTRLEALFAGVVLLMAPLHLSAAYSHLTKAFWGLLPLALLFVRNAINVDRSRWWILGSGVIFMSTILYAPEQLVFAALGVALMTTYELFAAEPALRMRLLRRTGFTAVIIVACVLPLLISIQIASANPNISVSVNTQSLQNQPDLMHFFIPAGFGLSPLFAAVNQATDHGLEKFVFLPWTCLLLAVVALAARANRVWQWGLLTLVCILLAMGPRLVVGAQDTFTDYELPVVLPYAWLSSIPGLQYMRTPGRFMEIGYVGLAVVATLGLHWVGKHSRRALHTGLVLLATVLVIGENMPLAGWAHEKLPEVPAFYQQIAADPEVYGVLDLPIKPEPKLDYFDWHIYFSSYYQFFQTTHRKGIHTGYNSRFYTVHPVFAQFISENAVLDSPMRQDVRIDGEPTNIYSNLQYLLGDAGYRYVVVHKPRADIAEYQPGAWGYSAAQTLVQTAFGATPPLVDDDLTTVYAVQPITATNALSLSIALLEHTEYTGEREPGQRWMNTPATFVVVSPQVQMAMLNLDVASMHEPESDKYYDYGILTAVSGDGQVRVDAPVQVNETTTIPLALSPGRQIITLTLHSVGNAITGEPPVTLNFAPEMIDLRSQDYRYPCDITVSGVSPPCDDQTDPGAPLATFGSGWYDAESDAATTWRWASSPAVLWYYSPEGTEATLSFTPVALRDAAGPNGKGERGQFLISVLDAPAMTVEASIGAVSQAPITLHPGWNKVQLALAAGNFQPSTFEPASGDTRQLSFALANLSLDAR